MSNRIIVSSAALLKYLSESEIENFDSDELVQIIIEKNQFAIPEISDKWLGVESRNDSVTNKHAGRIGAMIRFLKSISDQPIVISLDRSHWVEIENILV